MQVKSVDNVYGSLLIPKQLNNAEIKGESF